MPEVDVVVIGGGIVGSASAYELARRGLRCIVLERCDAVAKEASGAAAGMLSTPTDGIDTPWFDLLLEARRRWELVPKRLREETESDIELVPAAGLQLFGGADAGRRAEKVAAAHRARGLETVVLTPRQACEREPALAPRGFRAALLLGRDAHVSASKATQAVARAAERRGARFLFQSPVIAIERPARHRFTVKTETATFGCEFVVNAAGAWAAEIAAHVGLELPVEPVRGQILRTAPRPPFLRSIVATDQGYAFQRLPGHVVVGATAERAGFDKRVVPEASAGLLAALCVPLPALTSLSAAESWVGLRPGTPDGLPVLDAPASVPGFVLANGHFRNGILLGPLSGEIVAALVTGEKPPLALKPFALGRFGR